MIQFFLTGGTIDKVYNPLDGSLIFKDSIVSKALQRGNCTVETNEEVLFLKDSLDTSEQERALVVQKCVDSDCSQIIITHGTDTMVTTAQKIASSVSNKTIVLTGAMIPYRIQNSDALFNLGAAVTAVQCLPHGVYICMNGQIFAHDNVTKDTAIGEFTTL